MAQASHPARGPAGGDELVGLLAERLDLAAGEQHADAAVGRHQAKTPGGVARIQRHVAPARLQHGEEGDE